MKLSSLENKIGSALLAKGKADKVAAAEDQYASLDSIDKQILALCNTPATDARIKEFFTARDVNKKTLNIDHKIQVLMRQGFLGRGGNKYVLNPEFREFITVMPMTASTKEADGFSEDVLGSELPKSVLHEIKELVLANEVTLEVIAEELASKHNLDEDDIYAVAEAFEKTSTTKLFANDDYDELTRDVLFKNDIPSDVIDEVRELVKANDLSLEVIAEELASKYGIDEEDVLAVAQQIEYKGAVKKSFSLKKKTKSTADSPDKQATDIGLGMGIVDRTEREEMRESLIGNAADFNEKAVEDAELFMANEQHFYDTHFMPAVQTIVPLKGTEQGTDLLFYDIIKDVVEVGLKEYNRSEHWEQHDFTKQDSEQLINNMLEYIKEEYTLGNLDEYKEAEKLSEKEVHTAKRRLANKKAAASLGGTTSFTFNKHTLPNIAIKFSRKFLSNYRFPIAPDLNYTAVRNASTDDQNNTVDGEALITINFKTLSGVKKSADLVIPIRGGQLLEPSTFQVDGVSYIISQSAIDNIIKSATFYNTPVVGDVFSNPLDKFTKDRLNKSKLPTYNRGMFSL